MSHVSESSDNENTIHAPEEEREDQEEQREDVASVASTTSVQKIVRSCPFCTKELQTRYLFKHIRVHHAEELFMSGDIYKIDDLTKTMNSGSVFPFTFTLKNDFDETEDHKIYGCLGCNNTFTNIARGNTHCQKKKCSAKHKDAIKKVIKEETERLKKKTKLPKKKTAEQLRQDIILAMRRYKHLQHICGLINETVQLLLEKKDSFFSTDDLVQLDLNVDFTIPIMADATQLETLCRKWNRKVCDVDDKFLILRRKLFDYTYFDIDKFSCCCAENPKGLYVGCSNHEELGPSMYPPI